MVGETVNTVSGEIRHTIDSEQVQDLALNGRNYIELITLIPGVAVTSLDQMTMTTGLSVSNQSINGNRTDTNHMAVDGASNLVSGSNTSQINNVGVDFIQQVSVQTSVLLRRVRSKFRRQYQRGDQERHRTVPWQPLRDHPQRRAGRQRLLRRRQAGIALQRFRLEFRRPDCRRPDQERQAVLLRGRGVEEDPQNQQPHAARPFPRWPK